MIKLSKTAIAVSLFLGFFIWFGACKKDYIDYAKLDAEEQEERESYLNQYYTTTQLTEDGRTFTALLLDKEGGGYDTVRPTLNGVYYMDETPEDAEIGLAPTAGRLVKTNYTGWLLDGTEFDSGEDFEFIYGSSNIISGWNEGISFMKKGETARLIIPSSMAYGYIDQKDTNEVVTIPKASTLVFLIELINVQK